MEAIFGMPLSGRSIAQDPMTLGKDIRVKADFATLSLAKLGFGGKDVRPLDKGQRVVSSACRTVQRAWVNETYAHVYGGTISLVKFRFKAKAMSREAKRRWRPFHSLGSAQRCSQ